MNISLKTKIRQFEVCIPNLEGTAIAERITVDVPVRFEDAVNEWVLTEEAHQIIDDTKARHMGLILPRQMKELRTRLGFSQIQMSELFQVGEKSWSRWECGKHRPTRSISLLILAVYEGKMPLDYLLLKSGTKPKAFAGLGNHGSHPLDSGKRKRRSRAEEGVASANRVFWGDS